METSICWITITLMITVTGIDGNLETTDERHHLRLAVPPAPKHRGIYNTSHQHNTIADRIKTWTTEDKQNVWELSGLYEGDIMFANSEKDALKNGLVKPKSRWPRGIVPYYILQEDFDKDDIDTIEAAIKDYHNSTCLRFRRYEKTDKDYIVIEGKKTGCWSLVGRHDGGQVVNLHNPGCVRHGVIVHELLHALGFYHQQSAADRDQWVTINWTNIKSGKEHNFNKYGKSTVTDYGIGYDYTSVMHYSSHAFSKNGEATITPKKENVTIGQRKGLSEKDMLKLQKMYKVECDKRQAEESINSELLNEISIY